ncbi:MAG: trypsin-like peptidase domain-containing protein [Gemmatimonadota bacterium]|nr:trypsin-like peptidase domain-containing protein [Gemmatimonadota bacterium]
MIAPARLVRLDGPAAGQQREVPRRLAVLGSHPSADLHYPSGSNADVAPRHAAIIPTDSGWLARDLRSAAGTWVNGVRIRADTPIRSGDTIQLGAGGPAVRFEETAAVSPSRFPRRAALACIIVVAVLGLALLSWRAAETRRRHEGERRSLIAQIDSLAAALALAQSPTTRLGEPLAAASAQAAAARTALATPPPRERSAPLDSLARMVRELAERQAPLLRAASLDLRGMAAGNQDAVALVLAERASGEVISGTGFAVHRSGDTSWVATSRHVVVDSNGSAAARLGVVFNGTAQNFQATLDAVHGSADLALVRVVIHGGTPVVRGIGPPIRTGDPAGTITFPGGLDLSTGAAWRRVGVAASSFSAVVTASDTNRLQLDGYGARGMSGSPVFDAEGLVIGVVFGGANGAGGTIVYAVPGARLMELLRNR